MKSKSCEDDPNILCIFYIWDKDIGSICNNPFGKLGCDYEYAQFDCELSLTSCELEQIYRNKDIDL